ncbi:imidazole glycerol phosphate synthase subunit HisH [Arcanobacterium ihumii]|uniref:imidazole glycerol phosphate synthase subunit HisH n=1 Tax=Arcanobacterium ihumii TaxID=2138162 RepID=UPI000F53474A|nr:imidazole glycerol phosphate synthase subunit HisH [Arcanobacterium ihumii]
MAKVIVLDADTGNVRSVVHALQRVGADVELSADPHLVMNADGLVVPGVGAFQAVMTKIKTIRADRLIERRLAGGLPVFGICVGLQIMFDQGTEFGVHEGLGQWRGSVDALDAPIVPHMGWSKVRAGTDSILLDGLDSERFYFVHSFAVQSDPSADMASEDGIFEPPIVSFANHYGDFVAAIENGPLSATQFHPEKSSDAGLHLLENWIGSL